MGMLLFAVFLNECRAESAMLKALLPNRLCGIITATRQENCDET